MPKTQKLNRDAELNLSIYNEKYLDSENVGPYEPFFEVIAEIIKKNNYKNILDFACGSGNLGYYLQNYLNNYKYLIDGLDVSEASLRLAKPYYRKIYIKGDYKLPNKKYDFITLNSIIEHIYESNLDILFDDIKKKLNTKGAIFIVTPNINSPDRIIKPREKVLYTERKTKGHVNMMSRKKLADYLNKHGFVKQQYSFFTNLKDSDLINFPLFEKYPQLKKIYPIFCVYPFYYLRESFWVLVKN